MCREGVGRGVRWILVLFWRVSESGLWSDGNNVSEIGSRKRPLEV